MSNLCALYLKTLSSGKYSSLDYLQESTPHWKILGCLWASLILRSHRKEKVYACLNSYLRSAIIRYIHVWDVEISFCNHRRGSFSTWLIFRQTKPQWEWLISQFSCLHTHTSGRAYQQAKKSYSKFPSMNYSGERCLPLSLTFKTLSHIICFSFALSNRMIT